MNPSNQSYYESLPKKRMGAGCLFFDEHGKVLLVKPTYKPGWEIPGGVVELDESPRQCCRREVHEELGLDRPVGELRVVDYNQPMNQKTESLMFIFDGGVLSVEEMRAIQLRDGELSEFRLFAEELVPLEMSAPLRRRVIAAMGQASKKQAVYLENQEAE